MPEERSRTHRWDDPLAALAATDGLSGLEVIRRIAAGELPQPPIATTLGFRLVLAEEGRAIFECEPAEFHYNPIGTVHAGLASTLLDSAMGCAFVTTLERLVGWTTLELKANFTRPLTADTGLVRCTGSVVHRGPHRRDHGGAARGRAGAALRARDEHDPRSRRTRRQALA